MKRRGLPMPAPEELLDLPLHSGGGRAGVPPRPVAGAGPTRTPRLGGAGHPRASRWRAAVFVAVAAVWTSYEKVMASDRLKVGRVEVRGSHFLSEGEVRELLGPAVGENILGLDIDALKARLRASPWVADARVGRTLPDTLKVEIRERVPLALAECERLYLMDGDGGLIDIYGPRTAAFDLPIVRGLQGLEGETRRGRAERAGRSSEISATCPARSRRCTSSPPATSRSCSSGTGEVLLLADPPYRKRLTTFLALRKELQERAPATEYFDLRFRGRIYARSAAPEAGPGVTRAVSKQIQE